MYLHVLKKANNSFIFTNFLSRVVDFQMGVDCCHGNQVGINMVSLVQHF